jgi:hypothetical protein
MTESTWNPITDCSKIRLLAMTIPEKPTSSKQRYITIETGKEALKTQKKKVSKLELKIVENLRKALFIFDKPYFVEYSSH